MARQILRFIGVSITSDGQTFTWADLGTEDESQAIPSFSNVPLVKPFPRNDKRVNVTNVTTSGFTVQVGSGGDDFLPITCDFEVVNRDSDSVTGPTPDTDFSANVLEALCTPLDIWLNHPPLSPNVANVHQLQFRCQQTRRIVDILSRFYGEAALKKSAAWASPVIPGPIWQDNDGESQNWEQSLAFNAIDRAGCRAVAVATSNVDNIFTQMYTITFTSSTAFSITGQIEGSMGSGNRATDFTSGNGDFSISADAWYGSFRAKDVFHFSIYRWYEEVQQAAAALATGLAMWPFYDGSRVDGAPTLAGGYFKQFQATMKALLNPWNGGYRLPSLGNPSLGIRALPYDVDMFGRNVTKVRTGNKGSDGNAGEYGSIWNLSSDEDYYGF